MKLPYSDYSSVKENDIRGRYIVNQQILQFLENTNSDFVVGTVGRSVKGCPIKSIVLGKGPKKVMMWSQMHGNESTTTKAVLDLINFLDTESELAFTVLKKCTVTIIPILNPDGAEAYTRTNANDIDLNRDAQQRTQPESRALRDVFDGFQPDYCFNLHDQRTIFNVGTTSKPATVSFLAPAHDEQRSISETRAVSMRLIVAMNKILQTLIPGQIGRYDDSFNANCVGDTFQMLCVPTLLLEAGHTANDYQREKTREYIFQALLTALSAICENNIHTYTRDEYFEIPENQKRFLDIIIVNADVVNPELKKGSSIGLLFQETLVDKTIQFVPKIVEKGNLSQYYGHKIYDCKLDFDLQELRQQSFFSDMTRAF